MIHSSRFVFQRYLVLLAALIILGSTILGAIRLREMSFWYDEIISIDTVKDYTATALRFPEQMPAYFVALSGWFGVAGENEVSGRWLSLLCGMLTLAFTFQIAKRLGSPQIALFSLLVLGSSAFFVRYYREMRPYAFLACCASASMWYYLKWLDKQRRTDARLYVVITCVMLYTHFFAGLLVAAQGLYFLLRIHPIQFKPRLKLTLTRVFWLTIGLHVVTVLVLVPYLPSYAAGLTKVTNNGRYLEALTPSQAIESVTQTLTNDSLGLFLLLGLAALGSQRRLLLIAFMWLFIPLVTVLLVQSFIVQILSNPRYVIFIWPASAMLVGLGIATLTPRLKGLALVVLLFIGIAEVANDLPAKLPGVLPTPPWRDVFQTITQNGDPTDVTLINFADLVGLTAYNEPIAYYARRLRSQSPQPILLDSIDPPPPSISEVLTPVQGAWVLAEGALSLRGQVAVDKLGQMGFATCQTWNYDRQTTLTQWHRIAGPYFTFGQEINLQQIPLNPTKPSYRRGEDLVLSLGWQALQTPLINYSAGIYILDSAGQVITQQDGSPSGILTSMWQSGQNFCDTHRFKAPDKVGNYTVQIVLYDSRSGQRLSVQPAPNAASDVVSIFKFSVQD